MKAQLVNVEIKLNANTVVNKEVFPWEISILNTLHGEENVNELEEGRIQDVEGEKEEVMRLARLYGRNVLENRFGAGVRPLLEAIRASVSEAAPKKGKKSAAAPAPAPVEDIEAAE